MRKTEQCYFYDHFFSYLCKGFLFEIHVIYGQKKKTIDFRSSKTIKQILQQKRKEELGA